MGRWFTVATHPKTVLSHSSDAHKTFRCAVICADDRGAGMRDGKWEEFYE